jgi:regulator of sigma E protease
MNILFGLIGLSVVVIVHELGHYIAARVVGVDVETFSIGWGPKLFGFKRGLTEWRISAFPIGGFCKMKGEDEFKVALEKKLQYIPVGNKTFYGASPIKRILILFSGPIANIILAIMLFSFVSMIGITIRTAPNKIVLASELSIAQTNSTKNPADVAGLKTGDIIIEIDGKKVKDYSDLQELIGLNPGKQMSILIERGEEKILTSITPNLDKNSGQGLIGIYAWIDPVIEALEPDGAAKLAGIRVGDEIRYINDTKIRNTIDITAALSKMPEKVSITAERDDSEIQRFAVVSYSKDGLPNLGMSFKTISRTDKASSFFDGIGRGIDDTYKTFTTTLKSIGLLFGGVNVLKAVSGPARITYIVGNAATESIRASGISGLLPIMSFLAFLSVGLFIMNLLPIPALDGGQIVLSLIEWIKRKPLKTVTIYRYQFIGTAMILALFVLATFSDILFFSGR